MKKVSPKKDLEALWATPGLSRLMGEQIAAILKIIDKELEKSFSFGLELSHEHVFREKVAVLTILNSMGNLHNFPEIDYEIRLKIFLEMLGKTMSEELDFYFEKFSKKKEKNPNEVLNKFNYHLNCIATSLLLQIYNKNKNIPFL